MYQNMDNEEGLLSKINSNIIKSYERIKIAVIILMVVIILDIALDDISLILSITGIFSLFNLIVATGETVQAVIMIYIIKNFKPKHKEVFEKLVIALALIEGLLILMMIIDIDLSIFKWLYHLVFVVVILWLLKASSLMQRFNDEDKISNL